MSPLNDNGLVDILNRIQAKCGSNRPRAHVYYTMNIIILDECSWQINASFFFLLKIFAANKPARLKRNCYRRDSDMRRLFIHIHRWYMRERRGNHSGIVLSCMISRARARTHTQHEKRVHWNSSYSIVIIFIAINVNCIPPYRSWIQMKQKIKNKKKDIHRHVLAKWCILFI